jgi:translation initiation factor 2 subunit 1
MATSEMIAATEAELGMSADGHGSGRDMHRFYENEFPAVDEVVVVRVNLVDGIGAHVSLLEYGNRDGYILLSELSRRRMRSVSKHIRAGRREVLQVLRIDHAKGYIDLSKKNLKPEELVLCQERFHKSSAVHGIVAHVCELQKGSGDAAAAEASVDALSLDALYQKVVWPLSRKYGHAYSAFETAALGDESVFADLDIPATVREILVAQVGHRLKAQEVKIQADIQVSCFGIEGVEGIKPALAAAANMPGVNVHLFSSPDYAVFVMEKDRNKGVALVKDAIAAIQAEIGKHGGSCVVKADARIMAE